MGEVKSKNSSFVSAVAGMLMFAGTCISSVASATPPLPPDPSIAPPPPPALPPASRTPVALSPITANAATISATGASPAPIDANAKCHKSPLTQEKLIQMIHDIALHGDLSDVPFIEKTLGMKLERYTLDENVNKNFPNRRIYTPQTFSGTNVSTSLDVDLYSNQAEVEKLHNSGGLGIMRFGGLSWISFNFTDCGYLTRDMFDGYFGEVFVGGGGHKFDFSGGVPGVFHIFKAIGKYHTDIIVAYSFNRNTGAIDEVSIQQLR